MTKKVAVVGGGISGLVIARALVRGAADGGLPLEVTLYDENSWAGGKIRSIEQDGFTLEWGANGFLDSKPRTLEVCRELGIEDRLLPADEAAARRFLFSRGKLRRLPESPGAFIKSGLIGWGGKFRMAMEPFARHRPENVDESVADFIRRRLGKQALARLIDPMVSGVFAGDPENLAIAAAFPRIAELERSYGGLFRAMRMLGKERRAAARAAGETAEKVKASPKGRLTSFRGGLQELPLALAAELGERVHLGARCTTIGTSVGGYELQFANGTAAQEVDAVVLAAPAPSARDLVAPLAPGVAEPLESIPYARLAVVALGYEAQGFPHPLDGFGFLVPHEEERGLLGGLWTSSVFPGARAPEGRVLIRAMVGGARKGELLDRDDEELVSLVRDELSQTMGVGTSVEPTMVRISRHERAIPGYPPGHHDRLRTLEAQLREGAPGLFLGGNAYRGIGLNDCVMNGEQLARRALSYLAGGDDHGDFLTYDLPE